jgi:hypothetical protein
LALGGAPGAAQELVFPEVAALLTASAALQAGGTGLWSAQPEDLSSRGAAVTESSLFWLPYPAGDVTAELLSTGVSDMPAPGDLPGGGQEAVDAAFADLAWEPVPAASM